MSQKPPAQPPLHHSPEDAGQQPTTRLARRGEAMWRTLQVKAMAMRTQRSKLFPVLSDDLLCHLPVCIPALSSFTLFYSKGDTALSAFGTRMKWTRESHCNKQRQWHHAWPEMMTTNSKPLEARGDKQGRARWMLRTNQDLWEGDQLATPPSAQLCCLHV